MNKHILFIPLLALLGVSCSGEHITTTPVFKNAPMAGLSHRPTRPTQKKAGAVNDIGGVDLGTLSWSKYTNNRYFTGYFAHNDKAVKPTAGNIPAEILSDQYATKTASQVYNNTFQNSIAMDESGNLFIFVTADYYENTTATQFKERNEGKYLYYKLGSSGETAHETFYNEGFTQGYEEGEQDGYYSESNKLIPNGMYTGLTIFPRRHFLEDYAQKVIGGQVTPENGLFYLNDTNANYAIEMKWTYNASELKTTFDSYGGLIVGELDWHDVADGYWNTSWFGKYDAELHHFVDTKTYATNSPIETSFYPEVYIGSTFTGGDANLYFAGGGNAYQMGFADGQTYTIRASETYQNIFTIFTPAFRAVADFFNLSFGPFKVWYFFAIPLIVTLLILVLRLVKH